MWTAKEGCLRRMGTLSNRYKTEEEGRGVVTKGTGTKGEEEMEEEGYVRGEERGEKHPKLVIQAGQSMHAYTCTCTCKCVCAHVEGVHMHMRTCEEN